MLHEFESLEQYCWGSVAALGLQASRGKEKIGCVEGPKGIRMRTAPGTYISFEEP